MKRFPLSLRYTIPAILLILGSLLSISAYHREISLSQQQSEEDAIRYAKFSGDRTSRLLEYWYRRGNGNGADLIVSQLSQEVNLEVALLLDENNRVLLTSRYDLQKLPINNTPAADDLSQIKSVRQNQAGQVSVSSDRKHIHSIYPVPLSLAPGEIRNSKIGILFLEYNLETLRIQAYREAFRDAFMRSLEYSITFALLCIIAWFFFNETITPRAAKLVKATQSLSDGDLSVRAKLSGSDELAQISAAFNRMADIIQTKTEALQNSQISLTKANEDVTRQAEKLQEALEDLQETQATLIQTEKMSSLGQLVAGVAHEINNPVNFIYGNITHISEYIEDVLALIDLYQTNHPNPSSDIKEKIDDMDLEFIIEDLPKMLNSMKMGAERIREIVLNLRNFSRADKDEIQIVDIHEGLDSTLTILQHRFKAKVNRPEIKLIKNYGDLPEIECYAGQLNQVFMNIISNAIDALEEHSIDRSYQEIEENPNLIIISTHILDSDQIVVTIADNGPEIPQDVQMKLFDPFFTTKPTGKGTGLGLSISYQIVQKHGGKLKCVSEPGKKVEFSIQIPVKQTACLE